MTTPPTVEYSTIVLTKGQVAYVSPQAFIEHGSFRWYAWWKKSTHSYYAARHIKQRDGKRIMVFLHREILGLKHKDGREGDHQNRNSLDNTDINLRVVDDVQQSQNRSKHKNGTSGYKGVTFMKNIQKWRAKITANRKTLILGYFRTAYEAHLAYCYAADVWHGESACFG